LVRSQTYSIFISHSEVGPNQRDPLVDACARYLELELALLVHLHEAGVEREITFHERSRRPTNYRSCLLLSQQVLLAASGIRAFR